MLAEKAEKAGETKKKQEEAAEKAQKPAAEEKINWDAIRAEYLTGDATYKSLAEKYKISVNVLSKKATKEGWKNGRRKVGEKVAKKTITRAARAREEKALKGINLTKYIADLWTDNLKELNSLLKETPSYMLENPSFAAGIPRGLRETYELIMEMNGRGYMNRKLANEERKLRLEREKFELEKAKWEEEKRLKAEEFGAGSGERIGLIIEEDTDEAGENEQSD